MANRYSIEAVFKLIDNITGPLDKVAGKGNTVGKALKNDFINTDKSVQNLGKSVGKVAGNIAKAAAKAGAAVVAATAAAGVAFATKGLKDAVEFHKGLEAVGAKAGLTGEQLKKTGDELLAFSNVTGDSVQSYQESLLQVVESGIDAADSVEFLKAAVKASTGGFTDTSNAIAGLSSVIKSYNLDASAASQISDQMMAAARAGGVSFEDMATKLEKVLPVASQFGVSSDKVFAAVASLTSNGVPIATAAKNIKSALESGGEAGLFNILPMRQFQETLDQVNNSAGITEEAFSRVSNTTASNWGTLLNKVKNTGIKLGETLMPTFNKVIEKLSVFADRFAALDFEPLAQKVEAVVDKIFNALDFDKIADGITFVFNLLGTLFDIIGTVAGVLWKMRYIIIGIAAAWGIYKVAMLAAVIMGPIIGMVKAVQALMGAQKAMNVVQAIYNVLLTANPIGLIIVAIGVLIGLIVALIMNWDKVCAVMRKAWEWVKNLASIIWDGLCNAFWSLMDIINKNKEKVLALITIFTGPFGFILSIINELRDNWGMVVETFKTEGIVKGLLKLGGVILSALIAPIQGFLELLSKIPGVGKLVGPAVDKLDSLRANLKGTDGNVEKDILTRPPAKEKKTKPASAVEAAAPAAQATSPAAKTVTPAPPAIERQGLPMPAAKGKAAGKGKTTVHQASLLDLRSPVTEETTQPARAASAFSAPAVTTGTGGDDITRTANSTASPAGAVSVASIAPPKPPTPQPVTIPVKYDFPDLIIPADKIKAASVSVGFDFAMPDNVMQKSAPLNQSVKDSITPPTAPMTQAEQIVYSRTEHFENVNVIISPEDGASARVTKKPKSPNVKVKVSGDA